MWFWIIKRAVFLDTQKGKIIFIVILEMITMEDKGDIESFTGRNKTKQKQKEYILKDEAIDFP